MTFRQHPKTRHSAVDHGGKDFLTEAEMRRFLDAARDGRHGARDHAMMLMAYRHGLRVSELIDLRLKDIDFGTSRLYVRRRKNGLSTHQPIEGDELRALRAWLRERESADLAIQQRRKNRTFAADLRGGSGTLTFNGRDYPIQADRQRHWAGRRRAAHASGEVYKLNSVADFAGRYTQSSGKAGLSESGTGQLWLENSAGVIMHLRSQTHGVLLSLGKEEIIVRCPSLPILARVASEWAGSCLRLIDTTGDGPHEPA